MLYKDKMKELNTVIFDLGKVLIGYNWEEYLKAFGFSDEVYDAVAKAVFLSETWQLGDAGVYDETTWLPAFIANAPMYEREIRAVYERVEDCISVMPYTEEWIQYFKKRNFRIYYLSNYSKGLYKKTQDKLSFINEFDGGVFSFEEKCVKPCENIYKCLFSRYDIEPERAIFFDDLSKNIETAKKLGMSGVVFTPEVAKTMLNVE